MITLPKHPKREPLLPTLQKLHDSIQDAFNYEYSTTFEDILLLSQNDFITTTSSKALTYLKQVYTHNEMYSTFAKETITKFIKAVQLYHLSQYTTISTAYKSYDSEHTNITYLKHYRRHCPFTDEIPHHNCNNNSNTYSLIEVNTIIKGKTQTYIICIQCKKCYYSDKIILWCNKCKCEYYSSLLNINEQFHLLPATWDKYHCGNVINETMKCIQCKEVFNLNLNTKQLECSNKKCALQIEPSSILWNCVFCKKDFSSGARIFNPLEVELIKQSIKRTLITKVKVYPLQLPCCSSAIITSLKFYHKTTCKGQLYEGVFNNNKIVVCSKCNAMNFYDKFIWTCPLCNMRFRLCERNENEVVDTFYSVVVDKREQIVNKTPTNSKINSTLSSYSSVVLDANSVLGFNKTATGFDGCNHNYNNSKKGMLSSVSSSGNSSRTTLNDNYFVKKQPKYSTLIDIMKRRNVSKNFLQSASHGNSLSSNNSVLRVKALSRTESAIKIKNCVENNNNNKVKHIRNKVIASNQNTSVIKHSNNITNKSLTSSLIKFHSNNNLTQKRNHSKHNTESISTNNMTVPLKIMKLPKKIAINLFESFNKAEEEHRLHPNSTKAKIKYQSNNKHHSSFFDSILNDKHNKITGVINSRNTLWNHNIHNNNSNKHNINSSNETTNTKDDCILHIYQLKTKTSNSSNNTHNNSHTHTKALTGSTSSSFTNKTTIPNSKMLLINKQHKPTTSKFAYTSGIDSDNDDNANANDNSTNPKPTTNVVGIPSMKQQSSSLLNEILSTSIIPLFNIDQFKFLNAIGEGSYGKIYCIQNSHTKSKYALKKIIAHDIKEIKRYQTEFELVYSHTHPNIMKIYNIQYKCLDFSTFSIYVLMELAICDWNEDIKRKSEHKNPYKENELIILLSSLIKALSFLQRNNIAHRDIKPQNILLYPNTVIKVADFGEAKEIKLIKQQNTLKGTEMYMSPLLYNAVKYNKKNVEHNVYKSDVFSLGFCFLYAASLTFKIISDLREVKDMKEVRFKIGKYLNKRYSAKFINALIKMVEYNESERVDFIEMEKYIKENII